MLKEIKNPLLSLLMKIVHEQLSFGSRKELTTILKDFVDLLMKALNIVYNLDNSDKSKNLLNE